MVQRRGPAGQGAGKTELEVEFTGLQGEGERPRDPLLSGENKKAELAHLRKALKGRG